MHAVSLPKDTLALTMLFDRDELVTGAFLDVTRHAIFVSIPTFFTADDYQHTPTP